MTKYLGLDLGSVTCGISWSETGFIAGTVKTIRFPSDDYDTAIEMVEEIVAERKPDIIVLGLPLLENGDIAERAQICLEFGRHWKWKPEFLSGCRMNAILHRNPNRSCWKRMSQERKEKRKLTSWQLLRFCSATWMVIAMMHNLSDSGWSLFLSALHLFSVFQLSVRIESV